MTTQDTPDTNAMKIKHYDANGKLTGHSEGATLGQLIGWVSFAGW
jgi:hypothetical protein